jgi:hypothetical protein
VQNSSNNLYKRIMSHNKRKKIVSTNFANGHQENQIFDSNKYQNKEKQKTVMDTLTTENFAKTVKVLKNGRYQVSLSLNLAMFPPANTFNMALKRFYIVKEYLNRIQ